ncbi:hypothetical protein B0T24DRAFT_202946 [Lasiosphaeria ovina]|uniref:NTF2-like domain-containing protein n=1 Tax=Lasiosphaeria ovina TaxID=92902 RepID=A0AAE0KFJ1_9PEZI|nr:hypothetical protein B0T24DRAFT_202946 [Lasiosphaeria ovina]
MQLLKSLALFSLAAVTTSAAAAVKSDNPRSQQSCLCSNTVDTLLSAYVRILSEPKWNDTEAKYLADSFRDTSDSINILAGIPLGSVTFPSKQALIAHETSAPDNLPIKITSIGPYDCTSVSFIWSATFGAGNPVRGITILGATKAAGWWQIASIDMEMNSCAFARNIGGTCVPPGAPPS